MSWASLQRNLVAHNARKGWHVDVFFHTWESIIARDIARLVQATAFAAGAGILNGRVVTGGAFESVEIALMAMRQYARAGGGGTTQPDGRGAPGRSPDGVEAENARAAAAAAAWGTGDHDYVFNMSAGAGTWTTTDYDSFVGAKPPALDPHPNPMYDRVLVTRFDSVFHVPIELDALVNDTALYAANWCKAVGSPVPTAGTPWYSCSFLNPFHYDIREQGLPDFFFAGSEAVMWRFFARFTADLYAGYFYKRPGPPNHGYYSGRLAYLEEASDSQILRRFLWHDMDVDLARNMWCNGPKLAGDAVGAWNTTWWERGDRDVSDTKQSDCEGGRYFCALQEVELRWDIGCGAFWSG